MWLQDSNKLCTQETLYKTAYKTCLHNSCLYFRVVSCALPFITLAVSYPHIHSIGHPLTLSPDGLPHDPPHPLHLHGHCHLATQPYQPQHQAGPHHIRASKDIVLTANIFLHLYLDIHYGLQKCIQQ